MASKTLIDKIFLLPPSKCSKIRKISYHLLLSIIFPRSVPYSISTVAYHFPYAQSLSCNSTTIISVSIGRLISTSQHASAVSLLFGQAEPTHNRPFVLTPQDDLHFPMQASQAEHDLQLPVQVTQAEHLSPYRGFPSNLHNHADLTNLAIYNVY